MFIINTTIESVIKEENILEAIIHLQGTKDVCDQNGLRPSLLMDYWKDNCSSLLEMIRKGNYKPAPATQYEKLSKSGKKRFISLISLQDRLIARAVQQVMAPEADKQFSKACYSYRSGLGTKDMVNFVADRIKEGYDWVLEFDIKDFFDSIPSEMLTGKLESAVSDKKLLSLLSEYIHCPVNQDGETVYKGKGILQGLAVSPLLSNIYLTELDVEFSSFYPGYCRYGDDIRILTKSRIDAENAYHKLLNSISQLGLTANRKKCGIHPSVNRKYLGYELRKSNGSILICPAVYNRKEIYNKWQTSQTGEIDENYHIVSDGILSKKDFTLLFENDSFRKYIPIEKIQTVSIYSNVIFNTGFFEYASKENLIVNIADQFGNSLGSFIPVKQKRNIKTEIAQLSMLTDEKERLKLARELEKANIFNIRASLRYYQRRKKDQTIDEAVKSISCILDKINREKKVETLMVYEAQARQLYYHCFNSILNDLEFTFKVRTKRPPKDNINAMISFGNTLLYSRFACEIRKTDLDIRLGIIHSAYKRPENLNLDLADIFKPVIVDRVIFTLINRKMISAADFEESKNGGVYMMRNSKQVFIQEFNRKLNQKIILDGKHVTYGELLTREVKKLREHFINKEKYEGYRYVN